MNIPRSRVFISAKLVINQLNTVDGWNPANQLRLVVYPIICKVSYIPGGAGFLPSTVAIVSNHGHPSTGNDHMSHHQPALLSRWFSELPTLGYVSSLTILIQIVHTVDSKLVWTAWHFFERILRQGYLLKSRVSANGYERKGGFSTHSPSMSTRKEGNGPLFDWTHQARKKEGD